LLDNEGEERDYDVLSYGMRGLQRMQRSLLEVISNSKLNGVRGG